ncbi:hypothetical protein C8Q77DRAFT_901458 [Trametes polyzona]|nr:hypothetical protein C8Q77DRAFT_901458 [Trametes polyzona]
MDPLRRPRPPPRLFSAIWISGYPAPAQHIRILQGPASAVVLACPLCSFTLSNRAHPTYVPPSSHDRAAPSPRVGPLSALSLALPPPREYVRGQSDGLRSSSLLPSPPPPFSGLAFSHLLAIVCSSPTPHTYRPPPSPMRPYIRISAACIPPCPERSQQTLSAHAHLSESEHRLGRRVPRDHLVQANLSFQMACCRHEAFSLLFAKQSVIFPARRQGYGTRRCAHLRSASLCTYPPRAPLARLRRPAYCNWLRKDRRLPPPSPPVSCPHLRIARAPDATADAPAVHT